MKKKFLIVALIGLLLASGVVLVGCELENNTNTGGDGSVIFSIDKVDSTSFTVTVSGAKFNPGFSRPLHYIDGMLDYYCQFTDVDGNIDYSSSKLASGRFKYEMISNTVVKSTLNSSYTNVSGTINLKEDNIGIYGSVVTDGGHPGNTTYKVNLNKSSITF